MRIIEVLTDCGNNDTIRGIAEHHEVLDCWVDKSEEEEEDRCSVRLLVKVEKQQVILDSIQQALVAAEGWRIIIHPVEATIPRAEEKQKKESGKKYSGGRTREELYHEIESGALINSNYLWLVLFSTVVAAIGLIEDNVAVVIGAMVIAPLLGPNIALAFGAALGDKVLVLRALQTNFGGMAVALVCAYAIGLIWPAALTSDELMTRTDVGAAGIVLALVSGAAGVLSLTTGVSSVLVGVMVAVALLPPTATLGLMLAGGNYKHALGAGLLLAVNVVCVNLAAKLVFVFKGVKPRTWLEKQKARQSLILYIIFWVITLLVLVLVIQVYHAYFIEPVSS
ncbi:MAG: TIGR00341 family protein [Thioalkalispiraceae bacterium]